MFCVLTFISLVILSVGAVPRKPNILLIIADDLGYGDIGAFGNDTIQTPNIDRMAREGLKLTHHLSASPVCTPSRAAFMTGKYPVRMGMESFHELRVIFWVASTGGLPSNETTVAELARHSGYRTALIGKWHLGIHCSNTPDYCHHPLNQGFDYFYGSAMTLLKDYGDTYESVILSSRPNYIRNLLITVLVVTAALFTAFMIGLLGWRMVLVLLMILLLVAGVMVYLPYGGVKLANSVLYRNFDVVEQPIRFDNLTQRLVWESAQFMEETKAKNQPFLMVVAWFQVHTFLYNSVPGFAGRSRHGPYGDNVEEMDWSVGQLLTALDSLGLAQDTLVYFSSDNGGHVEETDHLGRRAGGHNGPWRGGKFMAGVDGGVRVPTVVRWPAVIPPGSESGVPTSQMDIFPTLAHMMGSEHYANQLDLDGHDLSPLFRTPAETPSPHDFLFHYCGDRLDAVRWVAGSWSVWKLRLASQNWLPGTDQCSFACCCKPDHVDGITYHNPPLLFNLSSDMNERAPLDSASAVYTDVAAVMMAALHKHQASILPVPNQYTFGRMVWRPWLQPCCNFPRCDCRDSRWDDHPNTVDIPH